MFGIDVKIWQGHRGMRLGQAIQAEGFDAFLAESRLLFAGPGAVYHQLGACDVQQGADAAFWITGIDNGKGGAEAQYAQYGPHQIWTAIGNDCDPIALGDSMGEEGLGCCFCAAQAILVAVDYGA